MSDATRSRASSGYYTTNSSPSPTSTAFTDFNEFVDSLGTSADNTTFSLDSSKTEEVVDPTTPTTELAGDTAPHGAATSSTTAIPTAILTEVTENTTTVASDSSKPVKGLLTITTFQRQAALDRSVIEPAELSVSDIKCLTKEEISKAETLLCQQTKGRVITYHEMIALTELRNALFCNVCRHEHCLCAVSAGDGNEVKTRKFDFTSFAGIHFVID